MAKEYFRRSYPRSRQFGVGLLAIVFAGCAIAGAPIKDTPKTVPAPQKGELDISSQPSEPIGSVQPVFVAIANGTDTPRAVVPSQIFALDDSGNRIAPLPAGEAARQAGGAGELKAALESAAVSGLLLGGIAAGAGAIAGSLLGSGAVGAGVGSVIGGGEGGLSGAMVGAQKADYQAQSQINALALQPGNVAHDFTVSGYVFFPKGDYRQIQLVLVDGESGDTEVLNRPWK